MDDDTRMAADIAPGATAFHPVISPGFRTVAIKTKSTAVLAAAAGTLNDLNQTVLYCDAYLDMFGSEGESMLLEDALWSSALVSYFRACDANGFNGKVDLSILDTVEGARDAHNHFRDLRSKYVAHSVSPLEQITVAAILTDSPETERAVVSVATGHASFNPLNQDGAEALRRLAQMLGADLRARVTAATDLVIEEVQALDLDTVYGFPNVEFSIPDVEAMGKPRRTEP